mmetsp:Transcript_31136/g.70800  ORF Transcript_31136/g.70800 Transcript_31136/m.70800 type:complete len:372 (+) Transcript_31136:133-1248(+)
MRLLAHAHVLAEHVLNLHDQHNGLVPDGRRAHVLPGHVKLIEVELQLRVEGLLVGVAHAEELLQHLLPQRLPILDRLLLLRQLAPGEALRLVAVVGQDVAVALGDLQGVEAIAVAVLYPQGLPEDGLGALVGSAQLLRLVEGPRGSVGVYILCRPGNLGVDVVRRELREHAHEPLGRWPLVVSARSLADLLCVLLVQRIERMHGREEERHVEHVLGVLEVQVWVDLEPLRYGQPIVLARPARRQVLTHVAQLVGQAEFLENVCLIIYADDIELLLREMLQLQELGLFLVPVVIPEPPAAQEELHRLLVPVVALAEPVESCQDPSQSDLSRGPGRGHPVEIAVVREVLQVEGGVLRVVRPLRVGRRQLLEGL